MPGQCRPIMKQLREEGFEVMRMPHAPLHMDTESAGQTEVQIQGNHVQQASVAGGRKCAETSVDEDRYDSLASFDVDSALKNLKCDISSFKEILLTFLQTTQEKTTQRSLHYWPKVMSSKPEILYTG